MEFMSFSTASCFPINLKLHKLHIEASINHKVQSVELLSRSFRVAVKLLPWKAVQTMYNRQPRDVVKGASLSAWNHARNKENSILIFLFPRKTTRAGCEWPRRGQIKLRQSEQHQADVVVCFGWALFIIPTHLPVKFYLIKLFMCLM